MVELGKGQSFERGESGNRSCLDHEVATSIGGGSSHNNLNIMLDNLMKFSEDILNLSCDLNNKNIVIDNIKTIRYQISSINKMINNYYNNMTKYNSFENNKENIDFFEVLISELENIDSKIKNINEALLECLKNISKISQYSDMLRNIIEDINYISNKINFQIKQYKV